MYSSVYWMLNKGSFTHFLGDMDRIDKLLQSRSLLMCCHIGLGLL